MSHDRAICGIDLADRVQELVVVDHDGAVLARRGLRQTRAWQLSGALAWARQQAQRVGFNDVVVACEPTGHRWRVVAKQCDELGLELVCVQPLLVHREREREDYTRDRSDQRDAVLIADLAAQLRCYIPERTDETYARLRHLGARREELITRAGGCRQQLGALLECAWPAVLETAANPLDSTTWQAAVQVVIDRVVDGDLAGLRRRLRWSRFQTIHGLSAVGAACILAQTGDLNRFSSARAVVKHAGLCPRDNRSGTFQGQTKISGRGRPSLRLAAWRAVWGALPNNPVLAARHQHLTTRTHNQLTGGQARAAVAGSLLRQLHAVVTRREPWDLQIAAGRRAAKEVMPPAA